MNTTFNEIEQVFKEMCKYDDKCIDLHLTWAKEKDAYERIILKAFYLKNRGKMRNALNKMVDLTKSYLNEI